MCETCPQCSQFRYYGHYLNLVGTMYYSWPPVFLFPLPGLSAFPNRFGALYLCILFFSFLHSFACASGGSCQGPERKRGHWGSSKESRNP
ncbi:hypothetical protein LZ31DRAFT_48999 [Colletotrichum somersetense]|nr:hypothetical protein LZ31DRAFT_48999 [Colletotrichum somersetense]